MKILSLLICISLYSCDVFGQQIPKNKLDRLKWHLYQLSADSLEGRRAGTSGELKAANYIAQHFLGSNLSFYPLNDSYFQEFQFADGYELSRDASLRVNNVSLQPITDFFPLPFSSLQASFNVEISPLLNERNQLWAKDISFFLSEAVNSPHYDIIEELKKFAKSALSRGATGLIFYSNDTTKQLPLNYSDNFQDAVGIPVLYITNSALFHDQRLDTTLKIELSYKINKKFRRSKNVVGFIDNKRSETVVIGAHYDHLGFGEDGNSMLKGGIRQIHNGADDNASGTTALIELAYKLSKKAFNNYNYILIGFSSEELGLIGSKYFVDNHDFAKHPIKFMINMDMVGRLSDSSKTVTVGGYGTSADWSTIFKQTKNSDLVIKFDSSGTGPSDHTSFYRKNIPVLFYFTGLHTDYHKPTDDAEKINYKGINAIINHIESIIKHSTNFKIFFSKTREQQTSTSARFSVSLGIMPDYSYQGEGVRIDGISEGKLAQKIGLAPSDILVQLGDSKITSVESYMQALSKFKKGDSTQLSYIRNSQLVSLSITFL